MRTPSYRLLEPDEPPAVDLRRPYGTSAVFLTCDHAGRSMPRRLGRLGLPEAEFERHIAWDIGAAAVAELLSARLDATLVLQRYSRLVIDCNRPPTVPSAIPTISETTEIPGNRDLPAENVLARVREIFDPYHDRIDAELTLRRRAGRPTVLVSVHSFTPVFRGESRSLHLGLLYNRDSRFAGHLAAALADSNLVVAHNQPYAVGDLTDYTIPVHGERRGIPHVMLEIRQDLVADARGQEEWADRLEGLLADAWARLRTEIQSGGVHCGDAIAGSMNGLK